MAAAPPHQPAGSQVSRVLPRLAAADSGPYSDCAFRRRTTCRPVSGDGRAALARLPGHLWGSGAVPVLLGLLARDNAQIGTVCAPMGVEEEYFLVDPHTRTPEPAGARVARLASETLGDSVCGEFTQEQIE